MRLGRTWLRIALLLSNKHRSSNHPSFTSSSSHLPSSMHRHQEHEEKEETGQ
jgi:hypothetical protein